MAIGLTRETIFIANVIKCRPPQNRDPLPSEIEQCTPYLQQQIDLIKPKLIVALGRYAAQFLLKTSDSLARMRKQKHRFGSANTKVIVTYHPAYLLRNPADKSKAYLDWQDVAKELNLPDEQD
jgi:uracil-DNA glycosylase family 4